MGNGLNNVIEGNGAANWLEGLGGLVAGVALTAAQFESNATGAATTADARFVYNTLSGVLFYDADGSGAGTAAEIATFVGAPALGAGDIVIIA